MPARGLMLLAKPPPGAPKGCHRRGDGPCEISAHNGLLGKRQRNTPASSNRHELGRDEGEAKLEDTMEGIIQPVPAKEPKEEV